MKRGIDVSAFQGIIDWDKAKKGGVEFAMIRAGWGTGTLDKYFKRNVQECQRLGIPFGVYWFMYCANDTEAAKNAQACLNAIKGLKLDYPVAADFEYDSVSYAAKRGVYVDKTTASRWVKLFLDTVKKAGYEVINYTNLDYYNRYFNNEVNNRYEVWFAYWGSATTMTKASAIWQYSSKGRVNGIVGNVDMDEAHKSYPSVQPTPDVPDTPVNPSNDFYGIPEVYRLVFDPVWYLNRYPDLKATVQQLIANGSLKDDENSIAWWLYQHFLTFGMDEADNGRYGCPTFNVKKYKEAYPDLRASYGDASYKPYYYHYMMYGAKEIAEGKRAKVDLSV